MNEEPKKHVTQKSFGRLRLTFTGEQYSGNPILDTRVEINGETLCWISWNDKDSFVQSLNEIIDKHSI